MAEELSPRHAAVVEAEPEWELDPDWESGPDWEPHGVRPSSRLLIALAVVAWLPFAASGRSFGGGPGFWALLLMLIGMTALPLVMPGERAFRIACLAVGWLQFGSEIVMSVPYLLLAVPFFVFVCPSGVVLLLASRRNRGTLGTAVPVLLVACPILLLAHGGWTRLG